MNSTVKTKVFGPAFWFAYLANTSLMIAVSIMFRYADFISYLGGTEYELGWIVGTGMLGAVAMRLFQGTAIDRYGAGNIWILSVGSIMVSLLAHLWVGRIDAPPIYLLRMIYTTSLAGAFGASITFVSLRAPANRTGETIGALGSSGFVGMALGPVIADSLFAQSTPGRESVDRMFLWAAAVSFVSLLATVMARLLSGPRPAPRRRSIPIWWLLRRYHPGTILLVGCAMGLAIGIPFSFLRPFTESIGVAGIRNFFFVYAVVAFSVRLMCRRLPDLWGVPQTVMLGMFFLMADMMSFLLVHDKWTLMIPATFGGIAHAFVFPAAMTGGSLAFPTRYRGLATILMLTMFDIGNLVGQPAVGTILTVAERLGWPPYPTMFSTVAFLMLTILVIYAVSTQITTMAHRSASMTARTAKYKRRERGSTSPQFDTR